MSLAQCQTSTYEIGRQTYDKLSGINIKEKTANGTGTMENDTIATNNETASYRNLAIYYGTTDVKVSTTSLKIDLPTFISSVGGNLGLFVGFSVLGGLFFIYDFFASHVCMNICH